ncbi:hypothetical protein N7G274_000574 [Stereocaulon virgatum]|uniref:Uncharacterized protein n=1 Tax=Stereocaulon virgatum TaxID=373712 RepID=A0ABR4AUU7_9LECA
MTRVKHREDRSECTQQWGRCAEHPCVAYFIFPPDDLKATTRSIPITTVSRMGYPPRSRNTSTSHEQVSTPNTPSYLVGLQGLDLHLYLDVRQFTEKLGMNCQPITSTLHPRYFVGTDNGDIQIAEGRYTNTYVLATVPDKFYPQPGQVIDEATSQFVEYKDTEEEMDFCPW